MTAPTPVVPTLVAAGPLTPRARQLRDALAAVVAPAPPDRADDAPVVWAAPWTRSTPLPPAGRHLHILDLHGAIAACPGWGAAAQAAWCATVAAQCRGAALLLVGSPAEQGFWSALLAAAGTGAPIAVIPYVPTATQAAPARRLAVSATGLADPALRGALDSALAWARANGWRIDPAAPTPENRIAAAALLATPQPLPAAGPDLLLDLRQDTPAERVATPTAVLDALAAGRPVISTVDGPLTQAIVAAGAGSIMTTAFTPPPDLAAAQDAAAAFLPPAAAATASRDLAAAIDRAQARSARRRATWRRGAPHAPKPLGPDGHVLVLSDESPNLAAVRVHLPFGALHRRGAIAGYTVLHRGDVVFDTRQAGSPDRFDALWVHRSVEPSRTLVLRLLGRAYAYDVDDNLLAAPAYRDPFPPSSRQAASDMLRGAAVVSCATARLAALLGDRLGARLADRTIVTRNLAQDRPALRDPAPPHAVIWASSDRPALTGARDPVIRAVRDHCLAHGLKLVAIGAPPPPAFAAAGLQVDAVGMLPHAAYREHLRGLSPAILVCPLETEGDPGTQDFVDGKSDIKLIEALSCGLVAVVSRAHPYLDSDLATPILCDNTYESWLDGLDAARAACQSPAPPPDWPEDRDSAGQGLAPWAAALEAARLPAPLALADVYAAMDAARAMEAPLLTADLFDEEHYLALHDDVRAAIGRNEVPSGFAHYAVSGRAERRHARRRPSPDADGAAWWTTLVHQLGTLEAASTRRAIDIAGLERRLALRQALAR